MPTQLENMQVIDTDLPDFQALLHEKLRIAVRFALTTVLEAEVDAFVNAERYERGGQRRDRRNGRYTPSLDTTVGRIEGLSMPRTRKGFKTRLFERYQRRQAELDQGILEMFVGGVSTARTGEVVETLMGSKPSPSTVSRVFHSLEAEYAGWKKRPLAAEYAYAFADGTSFNVIYDNQSHKMPILAVVGIRKEDGQREVLGFCTGEKENRAAWEDLLEDLKTRGVMRVDLWVTDGNQTMIDAIEARFPGSDRQRCIKHKMENVLGYIPDKQRDQVEPELKAIFYQDSREQADQEVAAFCAKYRSTYPTAVECLERDLTFYRYPKSHRKTIRTTNIIERVFEEVKKRSHKMNAAFRNETSCLLMFYAVIPSLKFQRVSMPAG